MTGVTEFRDATRAGLGPRIALQLELVDTAFDVKLEFLVELPIEPSFPGQVAEAMQESAPRVHKRQGSYASRSTAAMAAAMAFHRVASRSSCLRPARVSR